MAAAASSTPWLMRALPRMHRAATPGARTSAMATRTGSFRRGVGDAQHPAPPLADEFAGVASPVALTLALESLAIKSRYQRARKESQREKIRHLEERFGAQWGGMGAVAEAFGVAWAETRDFATAIAWYQKALAANEGSASIKASRTTR